MPDACRASIVTSGASSACTALDAPHRPNGYNTLRKGSYFGRKILDLRSVQRPLKLENLRGKTEQYCVVFQTLANSAELRTEWA